ncbi:geranylgeranyl reductase family protein [Halorubraceae archaeon YAN]|nr:geranylgeranyl reductase family protein [Halorubraceae archaeon YAN]
MTGGRYDVVIVGAGTAGCYAAATIANKGYDVVVLERKPESEAGHIACGDALKGANTFPEAIPKKEIESSFTNTDVDRGLFIIPDTDIEVNIPVPGELAVIDRLEYGRLLLGAAADAGTTFHYDTVVQDVSQTTDGTVCGVSATHDGERYEYESDLVLDGAGALSLLQDKTDFSGSRFDTNVRYSQFSSAYREVLTVEEPVEWDDALVLKPTKRSAGYLWYFPRTSTEINVGLGFQMDEEPMQLVEALREDISQQPEFENAVVKDKLGAALPTRRPYDSAVADGYMAIGDAAAYVNPISGGGIAGAAYSGQYAGEQAIRAIEAADYSEEFLWNYNVRVMDHFGGRFAALDVYNIFATAHDLNSLLELLSVVPPEALSESLYSGSTNLSLKLKLSILYESRDHFGLLKKLYETKQVADELLAHYDRYPTNPEGFRTWQRGRDRIMDRVYDTTGAEKKY